MVLEPTFQKYVFDVFEFWFPRDVFPPNGALGKVGAAAGGGGAPFFGPQATKNVKNNGFGGLGWPPFLASL